MDTLIQGFPSDFNDPKDSDLTISVNDNRVIFVHKILVRKLVLWVDHKAEENKGMSPLALEMKEDEPKHVIDMLNFCYTGNYSIDSPVQHGLAGLNEAVKKDITMYELASKYESPALQGFALQAFSMRLSHCTVLELLEIVVPVYAMLQPEELIKVLLNEI
ncbi:MAG: hypothetical protein Q9174_005673 [Haloplaca sp. 1 TL-2023]